MAQRTALQRAVNSGMHRGVNRRLRELRRSGFATVHEDIFSRYLDGLIDEGAISAEDVRKMVELAIVELVLEVARGLESDMDDLRRHIVELNERVDSLALHRLLESWPEVREKPDAVAELEALVTEAREYDRWE